MTIKQAMEILNPENNRPALPQQRLAFQVVQSAVDVKDMLGTMFGIQQELNKRIGVDHSSLTDEDKIVWIQKFCLALDQEKAELIDSIPWKWWKKNMTFDKQNARVEVIDMFHFVISLALTLDMDATTLFEGYLKKAKVNHDRQDSGYATKDPNDCRHI